MAAGLATLRPSESDEKRKANRQTSRAAGGNKSLRKQFGFSRSKHPSKFNICLRTIKTYFRDHGAAHTGAAFASFFAFE
jgi:hypothetical protein